MCNFFKNDKYCETDGVQFMESLTYTLRAQVRTHVSMTLKIILTWFHFSH